MTTYQCPVTGQPLPGVPLLFAGTAATTNRVAALSLGVQKVATEKAKRGLFP